MVGLAAFATALTIVTIFCVAIYIFPQPNQVVKMYSGHWRIKIALCIIAGVPLALSLSSWLSFSILFWSSINKTVHSDWYCILVPALL